MSRPPESVPVVLKALISNNYDIFSISVESFQQLDSFCDRNYVFSGQQKGQLKPQRFVLKIVSNEVSSEPGVLEGALCSMTHAHKSGLRCPVPIPTRFGSFHTTANYGHLDAEHVINYYPKVAGQCSQDNYCIFVMTFVEGTQLFQFELSDEMLFDLGVLTGKLNKAWKTFDHPGINNRELSNWHLQQLPSLRYRLQHPAITSKGLHDLLQTGISMFEKHIVTKYDTLSCGVIHTDIHDMNVLYCENDSGNLGVVDFMDVARGPYIFELANAAMDAMTDRDNPMDTLCLLVEGYESCNKLSPDESELLVFAIIGRLAQVILLSATEDANDPKHREYILTDLAKSVKLLQYLLDHCSAIKERVVLRPARLSDCSSIMSVHIAAIQEKCSKSYTSEQLHAWVGGQSVERYARFISNVEYIKGSFLVAEQEQKVIGFGHAGLSPASQPSSRTAGEVFGLYVCPQASGQGVGKLLLTALQEHLAQCGVPLAEVIVCSTLNAVPFYEKCGFAVRGNHIHPVGNGLGLDCKKLIKLIK